MRMLTPPELASGWQLVSGVLWGFITAATVIVIVGMIAAVGCELPGTAEAIQTGSMEESVVQQNLERR